MYNLKRKSKGSELLKEMNQKSHKTLKPSERLLYANTREKCYRTVVKTFIGFYMNDHFVFFC